MSDERTRPDDDLAIDEEPQKPQYGTLERTWLSPDDDDPQRDEAAERASKAVEPGRPRE
ncbi:MAG TPA: hypothetical protein VH620_07120 [Gaiella sp.]|jgi:hypothetical protein